MATPVFPLAVAPTETGSETDRDVIVIAGVGLSVNSAPIFTSPFEYTRAKPARNAVLGGVTMAEPDGRMRKRTFGSVIVPGNGVPLLWK